MSDLPRIAPLNSFDGQTIDLQHYFSYDFPDVSEAAMQLPALAEHLNELRQEWIERRSDAERELNRVKGRVYFELKGEGTDNFAANYPGKMTEEALKMALNMDAEVLKVEEEYARANAMVIRLNGTIEALRVRIELLRSSEATRRRVFESTPQD